MKVRTKEEVILAAVESLKQSEFKATAIKVELEAQLNRGSDSEPCGECNGDYWDECLECHGSGCDNCENSGGWSCDYCNEGYVSGDGSYFSDEDYCFDYIMERLEPLGLSKNNEPVLPLRYAKFYEDGSVDSEFTFTLMLDKPENIFLLPKVIEVFNQLADEIGHCEVNGAGMHMALLYDRDGTYHSSYGWRDGDTRRFDNFAKSMQLLMPALFCLGASNGRSRGIGYRSPRVGNDTHRYAVDFRGNALEFRVFDTCYDNPEQILDNVVVMSRAMQYWSRKKKNNGLGKIIKEIHFGKDGGYDLDRFYTTVKHIDLLDAGLMKLKPSYYTLGQIKKVRGLTITRRKINSKIREFRKGLETEYREYVDRFEWSLVQQRYSTISRMLQKYDSEKSAKPIAEIEKEADEFIKGKRKELAKLEDYIKNRTAEFESEQNKGVKLCAG